MQYLVPTSSLLVQHDAWLEEMRKEPSYRFTKSARIRAQRRLSCCVGRWLVSIGLRLQLRYWSEVPPVPEAPLFPSAD